MCFDTSPPAEYKHWSYLWPESCKKVLGMDTACGVLTVPPHNEISGHTEKSVTTKSDKSQLIAELQNTHYLE